MGGAQTPNESQKTIEAVPKCKGPESKDTLLKDFSAAQRDYIIHKLYPTIKKTLVHFVTEATMNNQIVEREESDEEIALLNVVTNESCP